MDDRLKRFKSLLRIAEFREGIAANQFVKGQTLLLSEQEKLNLLRKYRKEYCSGDYAPKVGLISPIYLQNLHYFIASIDDAIEQQNKVIEKHEQIVGNLKSEWINKHQEVEKIKSYIKRMSELQKYNDRKMELKQLDDIVMGRYSRNLKSN